MQHARNDRLVFRLLILFGMICMFLSANLVVFDLVYAFICILMVIRTIFSHARFRVKIFMITMYILIMSVQLTYIEMIRAERSVLATLLIRLFAVLMILVPFMLERNMTLRRIPDFYLPSVQELSVLSFQELLANRDKIFTTLDAVQKTGSVFTKENLEDIVTDLPRHSSFRYIANGTLSEDYFRCAYDSISDPYLYIVISNTGSAASELISLFTNKDYNHASLAFDRELRTIISYNGGERVYPPGLNHEMIEYFNKKEDSSIIVYRLACTEEQKRKVIDKVKEINEEGSAYNLVGLIFKYSHKPNILFCSQFVYKMLQYADLAYFTKKDGEVKPTDLVELDYHRKLEFAYEVKMNRDNKNPPS